MANNVARKVLVLDGNQRSALAVTRSLGRLKDLSIWATDSTTSSLAGSSRFCAEYLVSPDVSTSPLAFIEWLKNTLHDNQISAVFPVTEISSQLILMNRHAFSGVIVPFTSYSHVLQLADKGKLVELASKIGVNTPRSMWYAARRDCELNESPFGYPVVIKPCLSRLWREDHWVSTAVQIAHNQAQLQNILDHTAWLQSAPFMLQEFIPGHGAGIFAIYDRGQHLAFFAHRRLREKPPEGGVSVLSESVKPDSELLAQARKLLDEVEWHGVAMVEFRVSREGIPYLMEVNTRFWGSLQLAIDSGVDFPKLLWQIANEEDTGIIEDYCYGRRLRWLLGDLDSLYLSLKNPRFSAGEKLKRLASFFAPPPFKTRHEVNRWGDLKPALTELSQYIKNLRR